MNHLKKFEDIYYEPKPKSWENRVQQMLDSFTSEFVENNVGDDSEGWVDIKNKKVTISVHYKPEERYHGKPNISMVEGWRESMNEMIERLEKEYGMTFTQHHLTENGYIIEYHHD